MSIKEFFDSMKDNCEPEGTTTFNWSAKGIGFGQFYFYVKDGELRCENECMNKGFIKKMLCQMVDESTLNDVTENILNRPQLKVKFALDYHECSEYLENKYGYNERDYAGRFGDTFNLDVPYQDFWHFVIEKADYITNGCYFVMYKDWADGLDENDYRRIILNHYFQEFGKDDEDGIKFWVEW